MIKSKFKHSFYNKYRLLSQRKQLYYDRQRLVKKFSFLSKMKKIWERVYFTNFVKRLNRSSLTDFNYFTINQKKSNEISDLLLFNKYWNKFTQVSKEQQPLWNFGNFDAYALGLKCSLDNKTFDFLSFSTNTRFFDTMFVRFLKFSWLSAVLSISVNFTLVLCCFCFVLFLSFCFFYYYLEYDFFLFFIESSQKAATNTDFFANFNTSSLYNKNWFSFLLNWSLNLTVFQLGSGLWVKLGMSFYEFYGSLFYFLKDFFYFYFSGLYGFVEKYGFYELQQILKYNTYSIHYFHLYFTYMFSDLIYLFLPWSELYLFICTSLAPSSYYIFMQSLSLIGFLIKLGYLGSWGLYKISFSFFIDPFLPEELNVVDVWDLLAYKYYLYKYFFIFDFYIPLKEYVFEYIFRQGFWSTVFLSFFKYCFFQIKSIFFLFYYMLLIDKFVMLFAFLLKQIYLYNFISGFINGFLFLIDKSFFFVLNYTFYSEGSLSSYLWFDLFREFLIFVWGDIIPTDNAYFLTSRLGLLWFYNIFVYIPYLSSSLENLFSLTFFYMPSAIIYYSYWISRFLFVVSVSSVDAFYYLNLFFNILGSLTNSSSDSGFILLNIHYFFSLLPFFETLFDEDPFGEASLFFIDLNFLNMHFTRYSDQRLIYFQSEGQNRVFLVYNFFLFFREHFFTDYFILQKSQLLPPFYTKDLFLDAYWDLFQSFPFLLEGHLNLPSDRAFAWFLSTGSFTVYRDFFFSKPEEYNIATLLVDAVHSSILRSTKSYNVPEGPPLDDIMSSLKYVWPVDLALDFELIAEVSTLLFADYFNLTFDQSFIEDISPSSEFWHFFENKKRKHKVHFLRRHTEGPTWLIKYILSYIINLRRPPLDFDFMFAEYQASGEFDVTFPFNLVEDRILSLLFIYGGQSASFSKFNTNLEFIDFLYHINQQTPESFTFFFNNYNQMVSHKFFIDHTLSSVLILDSVGDFWRSFWLYDYEFLLFVEEAATSLPFGTFLYHVFVTWRDYFIYGSPFFISNFGLFHVKSFYWADIIFPLFDFMYLFWFYIFFIYNCTVSVAAVLYNNDLDSFIALYFLFFSENSIVPTLNLNFYFLYDLFLFFYSSALFTTNILIFWLSAKIDSLFWWWSKTSFIALNLYDLFYLPFDDSFIKYHFNVLYNTFILNLYHEEVIKIPGHKQGSFNLFDINYINSGTVHNNTELKRLDTVYLFGSLFLPTIDNTFLFFDSTASKSTLWFIDFLLKPIEYCLTYVRTEIFSSYNNTALSTASSLQKNLIKDTIFFNFLANSMQYGTGNNSIYFKEYPAAFNVFFFSDKFKFFEARNIYYSNYFLFLRDDFSEPLLSEEFIISLLEEKKKSYLLNIMPLRHNMLPGFWYTLDFVMFFISWSFVFFCFFWFAWFISALWPVWDPWRTFLVTLYPTLFLQYPIWKREASTFLQLDEWADFLFDYGSFYFQSADCIFLPYRQFNADTFNQRPSWFFKYNHEFDYSLDSFYNMGESLKEEDQINVPYNKLIDDWTSLRNQTFNFFKKSPRFLHVQDEHKFVPFFDFWFRDKQKMVGFRDVAWRRHALIYFIGVFSSYLCFHIVDFKAYCFFQGLFKYQYLFSCWFWDSNLLVVYPYFFDYLIAVFFIFFIFFTVFLSYFIFCFFYNLRTDLLLLTRNASSFFWLLLTFLFFNILCSGRFWVNKFFSFNFFENLSLKHHLSLPFKSSLNIGFDVIDVTSAKFVIENQAQCGLIPITNSALLVNNLQQDTFFLKDLGLTVLENQLDFIEVLSFLQLSKSFINACEVQSKLIILDDAHNEAVFNYNLDKDFFYNFKIRGSLYDNNMLSDYSFFIYNVNNMRLKLSAKPMFKNTFKSNVPYFNQNFFIFDKVLLLKEFNDNKLDFVSNISNNFTFKQEIVFGHLIASNWSFFSALQALSFKTVNNNGRLNNDFNMHQIQSYFNFIKQNKPDDTTLQRYPWLLELFQNPFTEDALPSVYKPDWLLETPEPNLVSYLKRKITGTDIFFGVNDENLAYREMLDRGVRFMGPESAWNFIDIYNPYNYGKNANFLKDEFFDQIIQEKLNRMPITNSWSNFDVNVSSVERPLNSLKGISDTGFFQAEFLKQEKNATMLYTLRGYPLIEDFYKNASKNNQYNDYEPELIFDLDFGFDYYNLD